MTTRRWLVCALMLFGIGVSLAAAAQTPPLPAEFQAAARSYRATIAEVGPGGGPSDPMPVIQGRARQALDRGELDDARVLLQRILARTPGNAEVWLLLARIELRMPRVRPSAAALAAYNGLSEAEAPVVRAAALRLIATARERLGGSGRRVEPFDATLSTVDPRALEQAAQALASMEQSEGLLDELAASYPPEFVPLPVETSSETAVASACVPFNGTLDRASVPPLADFVEVTPRPDDLGISARRDRLCFEGLSFGQAVRIELRGGLPSSDGRTLAETVTLDARVEDRPATLTFDTRNYVLPASGPQMLPLRSVNVAKAHVRVYRITERNMAPELDTRILRALPPWEVQTLARERGSAVFSGTVDLPDRRNDEATTGLPVDALVGGPLQPGVYVVVAGDEAADPQRRDALVAQWFVVTDIGLSAFGGPDGLHLFARSLEDATPMTGVEVALIARNNRVLERGRTDATGRVRFADALLRGEGGDAPLFVHAGHDGRGFTFLDLTRGAFDLGDRGVAGAPPAGKVDAFLFTERGIYRRGETVHATALARTGVGAALAGVPLTLRVLRPDGREVLRQVTRDEGLGGRVLDVELSRASPLGTWTLLAHLDPEEPAIGRTTFRVEDFVPPRIEVETETVPDVVRAGEPVHFGVKADYLYGAPASDLRASGHLLLVRAEQPFERWSDYHFGLEEEEYAAHRFGLGEGRTGADGRAVLDGVVDVLPDTTQPLKLVAIVDVFEPGGRPRSARAEIPFRAQPFLIGLRPAFSDGRTPQGESARFDVVAVDETGEPIARNGLVFTLFAEEWRYVWYNDGGNWSYERSVHDRQVATGRLDVAADAVARLEQQVDWGRYRIEVSDPATGVATSVRFVAGWGVAADAPDRPDVAEVTLDKESYAAGDTARVFVKPPFAGELLLQRAGDTLDVVHAGPITEEGLAVEVPVGDAEGAGGYLLATVFRPGSVPAQRLANRAIGVAWLAHDRTPAAASVTIDVPETIRPETRLDAVLTVTGGERDMRVVVAAVDDAVLQLTGYEPPDPLEHFLGQRRLAYEIRDVYGRLIDPYGAAAGILRSGGDEMGEGLGAGLSVRSSRVVALFSGIVPVRADGKATVAFDVPRFSGRLRLVAVAWGPRKLGSATAEVAVRDPVVADLSLPRFLAPGDAAELALSLRNVDGPDGAYTVSFRAGGALVQGTAESRTVELANGAATTIMLPVEAGAPGIGDVTLDLAGPGGFAISESRQLEVRATRPRRVTLRHLTLAPGERHVVGREAVDGLLSGTERVSVAIGTVPDFGRATLVDRMERYAYRCVEQTASRGLALLTAGGEHASEIDDAIRRLVATQRLDGGFGLWSYWDSAEIWLTAYVADFLGAAADRFDVPSEARDRALDWLTEAVRYARVGQADEDVDGIVYAHWVLARAGRGDIGRLRYLADVHGELVSSPLAQAMLAAAFARFGDMDRATRWQAAALSIAAPIDRNEREGAPDYGSPLRDEAGRIALLAGLPVVDRQALFQAARATAGEAARHEQMSTQEMAWLIRAAAGLSGLAEGYRVRVGDETVSGTGGWHASPAPERLTAGITLENVGDAPVAVTVGATGIPAGQEPAQANGIKIARSFHDKDGKPADLSKVSQGAALFVVLSGENQDRTLHHALVVDLLPAGFEIEGAPVAPEDLPEGLRDLRGRLTWARHVDARDDRFVAAADLPAGAKYLYVYRVRAVTPGSYAVPAPYVESMYRPDRFGRGEAGKLRVVP